MGFQDKAQSSGVVAQLVEVSCFTVQRICQKGAIPCAKFWGCSSVGRAPALQAGGRQFEPDQLHQNKMKPKRQERKERHLLGQPSPSRQFEPDQLHQNKRKGG